MDSGLGGGEGGGRREDVGSLLIRHQTLRESLQATLGQHQELVPNEIVHVHTLLPAQRTRDAQPVNNYRINHATQLLLPTDQQK
jgi:hypothetical protein